MESDMVERLIRLADWLRALTWAAIVLVLLLPTLNWLVPSLAGAAGVLRHVDLALPERVIAWALAMPPYLAAAIGLGQLLGFCRSLRHGHVFTEAAATALRWLGWSLIAASLVLPVSRVALGLYVGQLVASQALPVELRPLLGAVMLVAVGMGFVFGLLFVVFASVLREARMIAEENASFV
jgi:hypothetical protein